MKNILHLFILIFLTTAISSKSLNDNEATLRIQPGAPVEEILDNYAINNEKVIISNKLNYLFKKWEVTKDDFDRIEYQKAFYNKIKTYEKTGYQYIDVDKTYKVIIDKKELTLKHNLPEKEMIDKIYSHIKNNSLSEFILIRDELQQKGMDATTQAQNEIIPKLKSDDEKFINSIALIERLKNKAIDENYNVDIFLGTKNDLEDNLSKYKNFKDHKVNSVNGYIFNPDRNITKDVISEITKEFEDNKINIIKENEASNTQNVTGDIIMITGHNDDNFTNALLANATEANFKDKIILIFSCHEKLTEVTHSDFIKRSGAKAIIAFPTRIESNTLKKTITSLIRSIGNTQDFRKSLELAGNEDMNSFIRKYLVEPILDLFQNTEEIKIRKNYYKNLLKYYIQLSNENISINIGVSI